MFLFDNDEENRRVQSLLRFARSKVKLAVNTDGSTAEAEVKFDELSTQIESLISQLTRIASTQAVSSTKNAQGEFIRPAQKAQNVLGSVISDVKKTERLLLRSDFHEFSAGEQESLQKYYDTINDTMNSGILTPEVLDFLDSMKEMLNVYSLKLLQ